MHQHPLWNLVGHLKQHDFIDLTHTFMPGIPHALDMPNEVSGTLFDHATDGFQAHQHKIAGQWGTHCDPPVHFIEGGRTIDHIRPEEMIAPLVVFDVRSKVDENPDYALSVQDIKEWEQRSGAIPKHAFVALRSGWSQYWSDPEKFHNFDDNKIKHSPGWSKEAVDFLCNEREVVAFGHETLDSDPGITVSTDQFPAERSILGHDRYQIEALNLSNDVPKAGAIIIATFPKPKDGSGFPARVFAIVPAHGQ